MVVITFPDGSEWCKANWVFRQLVEDVMATFPGGADLGYELEKSQAFGHLALDSIDPALASHIISAIRAVAEETIAGSIPAWKGARPDDESGHGMYIEAMKELVAMATAAQQSLGG